MELLNKKDKRKNCNIVKKTLTILALLMTTVFALTSCNKDREMRNFNFNSTIEQVGNDDSKVLLARERWIYWEIADEIDIASDRSNSQWTVGTLVNSSAGTDFEEYNGVFIAELDDESQYFVGLFPRNAGNTISTTNDSKNFDIRINLVQDQPLTCDTSFDHNIFPMVAWYGGAAYVSPEDNYQPANLDFHSLGCLVRLQFFNSDGAEHTIDHVEVKSDHQLWGTFNVTGYKTADPYLISTVTDEEHKTLRLTCNDASLSTMRANSLHTFYVVVPAFETRNTPVAHNFSVTIYDTDGKQCSASFSANTRRNGITYMQALSINSWVASGNGSASAGLVGNGTAMRPFKIYNFNDLNYLRQCFDTDGEVKINNITVNAQTEFRIMRSDIVLTNSGSTQWTTGIKNFKGHMSYSGNNTTTPGITNNSTAPLFASIHADGKVEGLTVRRDDVTTPTSNFSPFCTTNYGEIKDCHMTTNEGHTIHHNGTSTTFAGICVNNQTSGKINGCGFMGNINAIGMFAGICSTNYGTVQGCYLASPAAVTAANTAAGVVYTNHGTVKDCYYAARINGTPTSWGGIVYNNHSTIEHCYASETAFLITSGSNGGIVYNNISGTVDYCWSDMVIRGRNIGSIACILTAGTVKNCFINNNIVTLTTLAGTNYAGGLVANMNGGSIQNSYAYLNNIAQNDGNSTVGGIVGHIGSGVAAGSIDNCYAWQRTSSTNLFYGASDKADALSGHCYLVGGSQTGTIPQASGSLLGSGNLTGTLNTNSSSHDDWKGWQDGATVPELAPYTTQP